MLNANNSYMHKHYIRFDTNDALACIQYYYEKLDVTVETLEHLIMQFVGMPLPIIRSRATTRNLLNIPWVFKSWDDAFAYYRSKHFQEPNERHAVTPFLTGAIEAYIVNKFGVKQQIYTRTQEFNLVNIEELIMTNKKEDATVKEELVEMLHTGSGNRDIALGILAMPDSDKTLNKPSKETTSVSDGISAVSETQNEFNDNTILNIDNLSKWVVSTLELSTNKSILVNRIVDHAKERELIGKQAYLFMFELANGFFTYSFKNLRHAEANFKKLKDTAQKFVKANPPKQMTTAEYMDDIEKQVRGSNTSLPVTQPDLIEETTMSATKPTQAEIYQSITKDPITVEAVRNLIRQLFTDSQNRVPREAIVDRFMESIDVSAHEHWSQLVNFILSDKYNPNRARLPFGDLIFAKFHAHLKNLESAGTFDFSGIPAVNDYADINTTRNPSLDAAKKEDVKVVETSQSAVETSAPSEDLSQPMTADSYWKRKLAGTDPSYFNEPVATELDLLRKQLENLFMRCEFEGNLIYVLAGEISELLHSCQVDGKNILPIVNDVELTFVPQEHHELFNDVFALQLIAFYLLHSSDVFKDKDNADYVYAILKYVDQVIRDLTVRSNKGIEFTNNKLSMQLNIMPKFSLIEGDKTRASYLIASSLVTPERATAILSLKQDPILMDLTKVPVEYFPLPTDSVDTDGLAIGIIQVMIGLFTAVEKEVKQDEPEFTIDVSKPLSGPEASYLDQPSINQADTEQQQSVPMVYVDAVLKMFGVAVGPDKIKGVFANMEGDFIQQMAAHIADHNVDVLHQFKAHPKSWWAFLAIETYFTYMVKNIDVKLPLPILGGFIYTFHTFMHTGIFTEKTELASLTGRNYNIEHKANTPLEIALFVADFMKDDSNYLEWYNLNVDKIVLPKSDNDFISMFSDQFFNDRNYAIYILACLMTRTINTLTTKPEENPVNNLQQHLKNSINTVKVLPEVWKPLVVKALEPVIAKLNPVTATTFVTFNSELLAKIGLTLALINGSIGHNTNTVKPLIDVYSLNPMYRPAVTEESIGVVLNHLAQTVNVPFTDICDIYQNKTPFMSTPELVLNHLMVSPLSLINLALRENKPTGFQPQPAVNNHQGYYGSHFDGPRSQPFQYPNAQLPQMQPGMGVRQSIDRSHMGYFGTPNTVQYQPQQMHSMYPTQFMGNPIYPNWATLTPSHAPVSSPSQGMQMGYAAGPSDDVDVDTVELLQDLQDEIDKLETVQSITTDKLTELRERMADIIRDL